MKIGKTKELNSYRRGCSVVMSTESLYITPSFQGGKVWKAIKVGQNSCDITSERTPMRMILKN